MPNLTSATHQLDRKVKGILRDVEVEKLHRENREVIRKIKLACNEVKLDVRDYEYAQTRLEQEKWLKIAHHNLRALETLLLHLDDIFGPADIAELSGQIQLLQSNIK